MHGAFIQLHSYLIFGKLEMMDLLLVPPLRAYLQKYVIYWVIKMYAEINN